jgi:hypothetical protein
MAGTAQFTIGAEAELEAEAPPGAPAAAEPRT